MKLIKSFMLFIMFAVSSFVSAKSFSLQVVQINGSEQVIFDASYLIEQTVMDYFFENAYIVSNGPVIIQKKNESVESELQKSYDAAQEGYLDYLIELDVYYNLSNSNNPEEALLQNIEKIEWKIILIGEKTEIAKGVAIPENKYRNDDDGLQYFAKRLAEHIKLKLDSKGGRK